MENKYYNQEVGAVLEALNVDKVKGLSHHEAANRLQTYGANEFTKPKEKSMLQEIKAILTQQLIIILLIAAGISLLIKEYHDAIGICAAVLLGGIIGLLTESRSKQASDALNKMTEDTEVKVLRNKEKMLVHKKEIVPGDIVFLESGDKVPADGRIIECRDLKVREDMLTGESDDVTKKQGIVKKEEIKKENKLILQDPIPAKQYNMLFGGTLIACGQVSVVITATGDSSEMGDIAKELGEKEEDTPLEIKMDSLGKTVSKVSTAVAGMLFIYMFIQILQEAQLHLQWASLTELWASIQPLMHYFPEIKTAFVVCVALIVAAVPEGLPTMINITLAITMKQMAKINVLVRKKEACETIGAISVICSDKTGTLTQNKMKVSKIYMNGQYIERIKMDKYFLHNCMLNSTADIENNRGEEKYIGSATECALLSLCSGYDYAELRYEAHVVKQQPFNSQNKFMLTILQEKNRYEILSKGAPEVILQQCGYEKINGEVRPLTEKRCKEIVFQIGLMQADAMRVLAFAYNELAASSNVLERQEWGKQLIFGGFVAISDPLREGVIEAVAIANEGGIETKMLTGDNIQTAIAIGKQIGIIGKGKRAVEAIYIDTLNEIELMREIKNIAIVARSKPDTKLRIVQALQKQGEVVAVTGDGINDAPALTKADVGIAMGISGTEVSKNAADIILIDDSFGTIVEAIKWGRGIYNNFQRFIQFQLTVNIIAFLIAIITQIMGYEMPFTTIHLLWINIIMDGPPALALGLEPIRGTVMKRKPIPKEANIINKYMVRTILINSTFITALLFAQIQWNFLGVSAEGAGQAVEVQTAIFSLFAFSVLFNALNCREFGTGSIFPNFMKNKLVLRIMLGIACIQVIMIQYFSGFFNAAPLSLFMWIKIIGYGSLVVVVNEMVKFCFRILKHSTKKVISYTKRISI